MATYKLYLDRRAVKDGEPAPLKIMINKHSKSALLPIDVRLLPEQWDTNRQQVIKHPKKAALNAYITNRMARVGDIMRELVLNETAPTMTATQIKNYIANILNPKPNESNITLGYIYRCVTNDMSATPKRRYTTMWNSLKRYDANADNMPINKLTIRWVQNWIGSISNSLTQNTQHTYLILFYGMLNKAVDADIIPVMPIKTMHIKLTTTKKRNLAVDVLQQFFAIQADNAVDEAVLDIVRLIFLLIGINVTDLLHLKPDALVNGRIEYDRSKTKRHYSIKVEPEAQAIIDKYRSDRLLIDYAPIANMYMGAYRAIISTLRRYAPSIGMPECVSTYYMRHSWATIAAELDIPKDTIALALGHGGTTVTDIYINYDLRKVDRANRQIIDLIVKK